MFLTIPLKYEESSIHPGQRVWFCNALSALTREEVIELYDVLIACAKECIEDKGDFTPPDVRAYYPHIYGEPE